jgi:hypothetical protein
MGKGASGLCAQGPTAHCQIVDTLTASLDEDHFRTRLAALDALASLNSPKTCQRLSA